MGEGERTPAAQAGQREKIAVAVGLWLGMFLWSNIPPFRGNVLDQRASFFVWHWDLYTTAGHGICDVHYYDMKRGGAELERWTLLGYARPGDMPDAIARTEKDQLYREYERVCRALVAQGDPTPEVEVAARCAEKTRWKRVEKRRRNVCELDFDAMLGKPKPGKPSKPSKPVKPVKPSKPKPSEPKP